MSNKDNLLAFPPLSIKPSYQRVKSEYSLREIRQFFGLSERLVRRWVAEGLIEAEGKESGELSFDFRALTQFRRVRELKTRGLSFRQIEAELQGQLNLFRQGGAQVVRLLTPFEEALLVHDQEGGCDRAAEFYRQAIEEGENVSDAYCNLGIIELQRGSEAKALDCFSLALKDEPRHVEAHYNIGNLYFDAKDFRLAKLHYETAREFEPSFPPIHFNLALVYCAMNEIDKAHESLLSYKGLVQESEEETVETLLAQIERVTDARKPTKPLGKLG